MVERLSVTFSGLVCLLDDMSESIAILQGIISPHADQVYAPLRSGCQDCQSSLNEACHIYARFCQRLATIAQPLCHRVGM